MVEKKLVVHIEGQLYRPPVLSIIVLRYLTFLLIYFLFFSACNQPLIIGENLSDPNTFHRFRVGKGKGGTTRVSFPAFSSPLN